MATRLLSDPASPLNVALIEPRAVLAQGAAYSTGYPEHLLNVIAGRMSAFDEDPGHFVRFLNAEGGVLQAATEAELASSFAPRKQFGRYLKATLEAQPHFRRLRGLEDEAIDLERGENYTVRLRSGARVLARSVVLAVGNTARPIPLPASAIRGEPLIVDAWDYAAVRQTDPEAGIAIVGSGLSMVDAVVSLARNRHRGKISVISRHGLMPLPHAAPGSQQGDVDELFPLGVRERMRELRKRAAASVAAGEPWQWTMDRLRYHGQSLWKYLDDTEQRRFLRHASRFWDIHRHRIAPAVAESLDRLMSSGQLNVHAGQLISIGEEGGVSKIRFRPRYRALDQEITANYVINATGVETNILRSKSELIMAMRHRGVLTPGPHGIGFATGEGGEIIDREGRPVAGLLTLGAPRIGSLWESIAIPELRGQAQRVADHLRSWLA